MELSNISRGSYVSVSSMELQLHKKNSSNITEYSLTRKCQNPASNKIGAMGHNGQQIFIKEVVLNDRWGYRSNHLQKTKMVCSGFVLLCP
jgi:hypothetical protein